MNCILLWFSVTLWWLYKLNLLTCVLNLTKLLNVLTSMFCLYLLSTLIQLDLGSISVFSLDSFCELIFKSMSIISSLNCMFLIFVAFRLHFKLDATLTSLNWSG